jgi:hypothetical protein
LDAPQISLEVWRKILELSVWLLDYLFAFHLSFHYGV